VGNKIFVLNQYILGIFWPKIINIGQCLIEWKLAERWRGRFLKHRLRIIGTHKSDDYNSAVRHTSCSPGVDHQRWPGFPRHLAYSMSDLTRFCDRHRRPASATFASDPTYSIELRILSRRIVQENAQENLVPGLKIIIVIFIHSESAHAQALASYIVTEFWTGQQGGGPRLLLPLNNSLTVDHFSTWTHIKYTKHKTSINQSINIRNFYSAHYKTWTAALDNVNI